MTRPFRPHRLVLFAASTAMAAGGVLVPATAFAATPATAHAVVKGGAVDGAGSSSTLEHRAEPGAPGTIRIDPGKGDGPLKKHRPHKGEGGKKHHTEPEWVCITAPCGPPEDTSVSGNA
ncbi:hypothetical protein [Streptomyces sp. NRRL S-87]|uniref:hypothetical protein n=1 Tax=Streptomyces sp. NRRL S-87 TaxID=1463920 RepID=UPI0004BF6A5D|nr:hypothetical protein [Streptomyces sp. NRRL S-87]